MNINIKATNIELTDSIKDYVFRKLEGIDKVLGDGEVVGQVEVGKTSNHHKSGDIFKAEINITAGGKPFFALSEKSDLYQAIDDVKDEIVSEAKKAKNKQQSLIRRGGHKVKSVIRGFFNRP